MTTPSPGNAPGDLSLPELQHARGVALEAILNALVGTTPYNDMREETFLLLDAAQQLTVRITASAERLRDGRDAG